MDPNFQWIRRRRRLLAVAFFCLMVVCWLVVSAAWARADVRTEGEAAAAGDHFVRHAGATLAKLELYEATRDKPLLQAAERAISDMLTRVRNCATPSGPLACIVDGGYTTLGANALAVMVLAKHAALTGERRHMALLRELGGWIQSAQDLSGPEMGAFFLHRQSHPWGVVTRYVSRDGPGAAVLALVRLYGVDPRARWLNAAERAARYLVKDRIDDGASNAPPPDRWLLHGLDELNRLRPRALYRDHTARYSHGFERGAASLNAEAHR